MTTSRERARALREQLNTIGYEMSAFDDEVLERAIEAAVAAERATVEGVLLDQALSWQQGNNPDRDLAIEVLRIAREAIRACGAK